MWSRFLFVRAGKQCFKLTLIKVNLFCAVTSCSHRCYWSLFMWPLVWSSHYCLFKDYTKSISTFQHHVLGYIQAAPLSAGQVICAFTLPAFSWLVLRFCGGFVSRDHGLLWSVQEYNAWTLLLIDKRRRVVSVLSNFSQWKLESRSDFAYLAHPKPPIGLLGSCVITARWYGRGNPQRFLPRSERTGK